MQRLMFAVSPKDGRPSQSFGIGSGQDEDHRTVARATPELLRDSEASDCNYAERRCMAILDYRYRLCGRELDLGRE